MGLSLPGGSVPGAPRRPTPRRAPGRSVVAPRRLTERLAALGCVDPEGEASEILRAGVDVDQAVQRRSSGEPLAWIVGSAPFGDRRVHVAPGVYVPRPTTTALATRAAPRLPVGGVAVDLCCGSGALAATLGGVGVDVDPIAAACARANGVAALVGDVAAVPLRAGSADVVTAVAPYVPTAALALLPRDVTAHEPRRALDGGPDGLAVVRLVVDAARRLLRPGGWLLVEVGADQGGALDVPGFEPSAAWFDEDGDLRGLEARRRPDDARV